MEVYKIDGDPAATDGQVPDAPARPTVAENVATDKCDQFSWLSGLCLTEELGMSGI